MAALLLWMMSLAFAHSVAVLPLEPGAKTEAYDGLGMAMAGLLVTDLSRVSDLTLIERAQIDKVISEIELGKRGYVDPKTAVQVGKLIGADWMVVGTWSVIEPQFLLSIRAVDVETGKVVGSASTQGTVQDYVTVEKEAVEQLLQAVRVTITGGTRRQILGSSPTESFEAMSTYAAGLAAERAKDYEQAKARFEAAAKADPGFDLPKKRLAAIRSKIHLLDEQRAARVENARDALVRSALAKSPDELSLRKKSSPDQMGELMVRWILLRSEGRMCQLTEEITHALERHGGRMPKSTKIHLHQAAFRLGLYSEMPRAAPNGVMILPRDDSGEIISAWRFGSDARSLVISIEDGVDEADHLAGLTNFAITCAGADPSARVEAITEVRALVRRLGIDDLRTVTNGGQPLGVQVELLELDARVRVEGLSERISRRLHALLALRFDDDTDYSIRADVQMITDDARRVENMNRLASGTTIEEAARLVRSFNAKTAPVSYDTPACQPMKDQSTKMKRFEEAFEDGSIAVNEYGAASQVVIRAQQLRLLGCVDGIDGMLDTTAKALAWLDTFPGRFVTPDDPECLEKQAELLAGNESRRTPDPSHPERNAYHVVRDGLWNMVNSGCASIGQ